VLFFFLIIRECRVRCCWRAQMAHGIIGKNAKRAVTRKLMERLWLQEEGRRRRKVYSKQKR
jgi:hypothetical protein